MEAAMAQLLLATIPPSPLLFQGTPLPDKTRRASMGIPPVELGSPLAPRGAYTRGASGSKAHNSVSRVFSRAGVHGWIGRKCVWWGGDFLFLFLSIHVRQRGEVLCRRVMRYTLTPPGVYAPRGAKADPSSTGGTTMLARRVLLSRGVL